MVYGNKITGDTGVASVDGSTSAGILVTTYFAPGTTAEIDNNTITGNTTAVAVGYDLNDTSSVTMTGNDLSGNGDAVENSGSPTVEAAGNWWGSITGPTTGGNPGGTGEAIFGNVAYAPWTGEISVSGAGVSTVPVAPTIAPAQFSGIVSSVAAANVTAPSPIPVTVSAGGDSDVAAVLASVAAVTPPTAPVSINLDLTNTTVDYTDMVVSVPQNVTLVISGTEGTVVIQGNSPALTVTSGDGDVVIGPNVVLTTSTDSPTVLVTGGSLTVSGSTITQDDPSSSQPAVEVEGGTVDLGDTGTPGGNIIDVEGSGSLVDNTSGSPVLAFGNTWQVSGSTVSNPRTAISSGTDPVDWGGGSPVLTGSPTLTAIAENASNPAGNTVSSLVSGLITEPFGSPGAVNAIAVTAVHNSNGTWQFELASGGGWQDITGVLTANALLLGPTDLVRFVPNADFNTAHMLPGQTVPTMTFCSWNETAGTDGGYADTTSNGGYTPFSSSSDSASISVWEVNQTPVAAKCGVVYVMEDSLNNTFHIGSLVNYGAANQSWRP